MGKKRKMNKLFNEGYVRNRRYQFRNPVQKENVLSLVFYNANIAVLGILVMHDILVFPLCFDGIIVQSVRLTGNNQKTR